MMSSERLILQSDELHLCFWPVDNTTGADDEGVALYKQTLQEQCTNSTMAKLMVPLRLVKFHDLVLELSSDAVGKEAAVCQAMRRKYASPQKRLNYISLSDLREVYTCCVQADMNEGDFLQAVQFLHDHGALTQYRQGADAALQELVILNPSWLLETLSCILRDPKKQRHPTDRHIQRDRRDELFERGDLNTFSPWKVSLMPHTPLQAFWICPSYQGQKPSGSILSLACRLS